MIRSIQLDSFSYQKGEGTDRYRNTISYHAKLTYQDGTTREYDIRDWTSKAWQDKDGISYYAEIKDKDGNEVQWLKSDGWASLEPGTYTAYLRTAYLDSSMRESVTLPDISSNTANFDIKGAPVSATIQLDKSSATLYAGAAPAYSTLSLHVTATGAVKFRLSDKKVAKVSSRGKITAAGKGKATITAYLVADKNVKAKCKVTVKDPALTLSVSSLTIKKGKKATITATASPVGTIKFGTSNKKIATVCSKGVVKGKKKGSCEITVSCNGVKKTVKVKVK